MQVAEGTARSLLFKGIATQDVAVPFRAQDALELTILMPCLNEAKTVGQCVEAASSFLRHARIRGEVVVADNGSTDGSRELAMAAGARVVHVPDRGYGAALMGGIEAAAGTYVIMGDADCSYDFQRLEGFVEKLRGGADLVMGNRFGGGIESGAMPALHRYLGNPVLSFVGRLFFRTGIRDFHCGLRGFSREKIVRLGLVTRGMEFASEMVARAALAGLNIAEVPTVLRPDGRDRPPHLRTWRDGWRHLRFLLLFCPRWLFLYPGLLLLASGLTGFAVLRNGPVQFPFFGLGVHSLLYMAAAVVLGIQMIQLAVLTKWMGVLSRIVPKPPWLARAERFLSLELGLCSGIGLVFAGVAWSMGLVYHWGESGFGPLDPAQAMRAVIPAVTLMIIGSQAAAGALFAAALKACWPNADDSSRNG